MHQHSVLLPSQSFDEAIRSAQLRQLQNNRAKADFLMGKLKLKDSRERPPSISVDAIVTADPNEDRKASEGEFQNEQGFYK